MCLVANAIVRSATLGRAKQSSQRGVTGPVRLRSRRPSGRLGGEAVGRLAVTRAAGVVRIRPRARRATQVNGQPGTLNFDGEGRLISVFVFEIAEGALQAIRSIINPDKLSHLGYPLSPVASRGT